MLTRKDYVAVADVIAYSRNQTGVSAGKPPADDTLAGYIVALNDVSFALADQFAKDNPAFNRDKFLAACGMVL